MNVINIKQIFLNLFYFFKFFKSIIWSQLIFLTLLIPRYVTKVHVYVDLYSFIK